MHCEEKSQKHQLISVPWIFLVKGIRPWVISVLDTPELLEIWMKYFLYPAFENIAPCVAIFFWFSFFMFSFLVIFFPLNLLKMKSWGIVIRIRFLFIKQRDNGVCKKKCLRFFPFFLGIFLLILSGCSHMYLSRGSCDCYSSAWISFCHAATLSFLPKSNLASILNDFALLLSISRDVYAEFCWWKYCNHPLVYSQCEDFFT